MGSAPGSVFPQIGTHKTVYRLTLKLIAPAAGKSKNSVELHWHWNSQRTALIYPESTVANIG